MSTAFQVEAFLYGALEPSRPDHDVLAHALNERFVELGGNHPVPYVRRLDAERRWPAGRSPVPGRRARVSRIDWTLATLPLDAGRRGRCNTEPSATIPSPSSGSTPWPASADSSRELVDEVRLAEAMGLGSVFMSERFDKKEAACSRARPAR